MIRPKNLILITGYWLLFTSFALAFDLKVSLDRSSVKQGQTFVAFVESSERLSELTGVFLEKEVKFYPWGYQSRGIFGVPLDTPEGRRSLFIRAVDSQGNIKEVEAVVTVLRGKFISESFILPKAKVELLAPEIIEADWAKISAVISKEAEEQIWRGKFKLPVRGKISMPFGTYQIINRQPAGRHQGVDISGKAGALIRATNEGMVVLAEKLLAHGHTVIIDHGQGVFTMYLHLSKIKVKPGDRVSSGQVIGTMGTSGVSSGPHLHFGLSVHDVRVDPVQWVREKVAE